MDGTLVLGIVAVLTSGVVGPYVVHRTTMVREDRDDQRAVLDSAIDQLTATRARIAWLSSGGVRGADLAELEGRHEALLRDTQAIEACAVKLRLRLDDDITSAYGSAGGAVNEYAALLWDRLHRKFATPVDFQAKVDEAEGVFDEAYFCFIREAREWHQGPRPFGLPRRLTRRPAKELPAGEQSH